MSAGMGLKDIVGSGDGPYGAGVEQIRSAWMSEDFDAATEGWDRWLRPQLNALARERDEAADWKRLVHAMLRTVVERLEKHGGPSERWAGPLEKAWSKLHAVCDNDDVRKVWSAALWWLGFALNGLIDRIAERERRAARHDAVEGLRHQAATQEVYGRADRGR